MPKNGNVERVCHVQPLSVTKTATFVIDVSFNDLKAEDLGMWKNKGTKSVYFVLSKNGNIEIVTKTCTTAYVSANYTHGTYQLFKWIVIDIRGKEILSLFGLPASYTQPVVPPFMQRQLPVRNVKPFYLKKLTGNIQVCQGCRGSLRMADGSIPGPPYDIVVARMEQRPYPDHNGTLRTPTKFSASHYHVFLTCIQAGEPNFILLDHHQSLFLVVL